MKNRKDKSEKATAPRGKPAGKAAAGGASRGKYGKAAKAEIREDGRTDGERIAKRLARAGLASRRDAEAMIEAGRVKVNGRVLSSPAFNVRPSDRIEVDDEPLPAAERTRLFLFHKPAGVVTTTRDPEGRRTIFDTLPEGLPRLITIGRLDINTEGLILLTNDGGLARVLELPSTGWLRRYRVRVHGKVDPKALAELENGIAVDGVFYGAITASLDRQQGSNAWLTLGLREGKNREVKNVLGALGLEVTRLIRISYGPLQLGDLPEGAVLEVKGRTLRDQLGERLIEQAGANFEAPIAKPFANKPVRAERRTPEEEKRKTGAEESAGRPEKKPANRRKSREEMHEEARDRLQTKRPDAFKGKGNAAQKGKDQRPPRFSKTARPQKSGQERMSGDSKTERPARAPIERRSRASNVWMAPGARPVGKKRAEEASKDAEKKPRAGRPATGRADRRDGDRPPRPGKGRRER